MTATGLRLESGSWRSVIKRQTLALSLLALALIPVLLTAACAGGAGLSPTTSASTDIGGGSDGQGDSTATAVTLSPDQAIQKVKSMLAPILGIDAGAISVAKATASSPQADTVLEWPSGTVEVDSTTGRIYSVALQRGAAGTPGQALSEEGLRYEAVQVVTGLGWTPDMLSGLGFREEQSGAFTENGGVYTLSWAKYDDKGARTDGLVEVGLDAGTAKLLSFSVSLGSQGTSILGAMNEADARRIAESEIYLKTDQPKLNIDGNGDLVLLNEAVSEKLGVVSDAKITKGKPMLLWVIRITGDFGSQEVGGTVYIDAKTGAVRKYVPLHPPVSTTTTTSPE